MGDNSIKVTLGGADYAVPKLNIGQLRRITKLFRTADTGDISYDVLGVAMERVAPKVDVETIEAGLDEVGNAVKSILEFAGFKRDDAVPNPQAPAEGAV